MFSYGLSGQLEEPVSQHRAVHIVQQNMIFGTDHLSTKANNTAHKYQTEFSQLEAQLVNASEAKVTLCFIGMLVRKKQLIIWSSKPTI